MNQTRYAILIALLLALTDVTALRINEVLYDPAGNDNNKEFIEIFNEEPVNLTGWVIADAESNDTLTEVKYVDQYSDQKGDQNQSYYALIVEEGFNATDINVSIYTAGATIGNNLNNDYDELRLYDNNGTPVTNMSYNLTTNTSLEYYKGTYEESLVFNGTPGKENSREHETINETTRETETNEIMNETTSNETGNETGSESINVSINRINNSEEKDNTDPCNKTFTIQTAKDLVQNKEQLTYQLVLDTDTNATATFEYWIEDLKGVMVRKKRTTHNAEPKSFTPTIAEPEKVLVIKATAVTEECTFHAEKMFVVRNPDAEEKSAPKESVRQKQEQQKKEPTKKILYESENIPETAILENGSATVSLTLHLTNDDEDHHFEVGSYVFRGSKSYSGNREENKQEFVLGAGQEIHLQLSNTVTNLTPGTYALKIKIRKDNQVSTTDVTEKIIFEELPEQEKDIPKEIKTLISPQSATTPAARVVQRQNPLPTILGAMVMGVLLVFIWVRR